MGDQTSHGDKSPIIQGGVGGDFVNGDYIIYGDSSRDRTDVKFSQPKKSIVTKNRSLAATIFSFVLLLIDIIGAYQIISDIISGHNESGMEIAEFPFGELISQIGWWAVAGLVLLLLTIWLARYTYRRFERWPEVKGKIRILRSLYPATDGVSFVRADASAVCYDCRNGNRPDNWRPIRTKLENGVIRGYYNCNINSHGEKPFDIYSIFSKYD